MERIYILFNNDPNLDEFISMSTGEAETIVESINKEKSIFIIDENKQINEELLKKYVSISYQEALQIMRSEEWSKI